MESIEESTREQSEELTYLIVEVIDVTKSDDSKASRHLTDCLKNLQENLQKTAPIAKQVAGFACLYDLDEHVSGNGYRSYCKVFLQSLECAIQECKEVRDKKRTWMFNSGDHARSIQSWSNVFAAFDLIFRMLVIIHTSSVDGCLIPTYSEELFHNMDTTIKLDMSVFFGHVSGFQFLPSMRMFLSGWCTLLTMFSEMSSAGVTNNTYTPAFINGLKYLYDKEARAKRIVALSSKGSLIFFTKFLAITDHWFVENCCSLAEPRVPVNVQVSVPPVNLELPVLNGGVLKVTPPASSLGCRPLDCRLLCGRTRQGMIGTSSSQSHSAPSPGLIVYYHGGGFVATSSKNFEIYLKYWAIKLDVPIFCVDYSLAPEARYPRQLEECFYAYCWALNNANLLGTTADKICFCGDSAGGTLALGVALKCIEHGVRLPSGIFLVYTPLILNMTMCPARLLSLIDPIIPFGFLIKCFEAYLGESGGKISELISDLIYVDEKELECMKTLGTKESTGNSTKNEICQQKAVGSHAAGNTFKQAASSFFRKFTRYVPLLDSHSHRSSSQNQEIGQTDGEYEDTNTLSCSSTNHSETPAKMTVTTSISGRTSVKDFHMCKESPDPYLSPYYAESEVLRQLPKIGLLTTDLDPCLDDNVAFAKKMRSCGVNVNLDILEGLPHGFLMFVLGSEDAKRGSQKAIASIRSILES